MMERESPNDWPGLLQPSFTNLRCHGMTFHMSGLGMSLTIPFYRLVALVALALAASLPVASVNAADLITVVLDEAKVLQLPPGASTIILGNPAIADVSMLKRNSQMILTGKSFGQTNLIALDQDGKSVGESTVVVVGISGGLVVQRGLQRETWNCSPRCNPTVTLGDDSKFLADTSGQVLQRNSNAQPAGRK